ncbi:MAG: ribosomal L7Ae/L30e/S12e/Gadd45 family protein [Thermotogae bacterium]|nr:ribosomal L7Ae/L30e/S12e/Gadd45 family protein [Thermotogota bacterium]
MSRDGKILGLLGFAFKSRNFVFGKEGIRAYIRSNQRNKIVLLSSDTGDSTKEDTIKRCKSHEVIYYIFNSVTKSDISDISGKSDISILGITDENIAKGIIDIVINGGEI